MIHVRMVPIVPVAFETMPAASYVAPPHIVIEKSRAGWCVIMLAFRALWISYIPG